MTFGNRLKTIRKNAKLSQNELAQKLYVTNKTKILKLQIFIYFL